MNSPLSDQIRVALEDAVEKAKAPGAVAYVGDLEHTHAHIAVGSRQTVPAVLPAEPDTLYDLASVTKVMATATAILLLNQDGVVDLDAPVTDFLPIPAFSTISVRHCITHTAGLNPGRPFYKDSNTIDGMLERYAAMPLSWPAGTRWLYSDVGYMILGRIVELASKQKFDAFCRQRIFEPFKLTRTAFNPPAEWVVNCAATENSEWRGKVMIGQVHDENAYAVGGVAGHAGLFSTASDIARYARALLAGQILKLETVAAMAKVGATAAWPWQGLGWQLDAWPTKNFGFLPARDAMGHAGWTGTSVWIDRKANRFVILLSNTCHPSRDRRDNESLRKVFHTAVGKLYYPKSTNAHCGLDRLVREDFRDLRGKRVALLTHHAAVDQLGRHILDVFALAPNVKIVRLFSPEHGIRGQAEAGAAVSEQESKIPVVSLYGKRTAPLPDELAGVDVFVIDLQDVGARFYTYPATMKACLKACAAAKVPVLVLDRPNPIGGSILEGPLAASSDSMVCWGLVPVRHGMTMGEIALYLRDTELRDLTLSVSVNALDSWAPERLFSECSLPWIPPSPNIPTPETALIYSGTCLFEGCNVNEGRGTDAPFMQFGAPWVDSQRVLSAVPAAALAGVSIEAVSYTPKSIPGRAANPKYKEKGCHGLRIALHNAHAVRPFTTAIALIIALRDTHSDHFKWEKSFDVLAGGPQLREAIERGDSADKIVADAAAGIAAFNATRPTLYVEPPQA
ncbi:MAG TPA: DUF1343 domain-containing protein [Candidatus Hydrogenedentes bacterium]|nr:DUF1343 domain-containing protein [Candidatus Hydrogenedentota bacterium]